MWPKALVLGAVWLALAQSKLRAPSALARYLEDAIGVGADASTLVAVAIGIFELSLGLAFVWLALRRASWSIALHWVSLLAAAALGAATAFGPGRVSCGCVGSIEGPDTLARRIVVIGAIMFISAGELTSGHKSGGVGGAAE